MRTRASLIAQLPLLLLPVLVGCGSTEPGPYSGGYGGSGTLTVQNDGAQTIFKVRFSLQTDPSWGQDRLGAAEVIASGARRSWIVPAGDYQVKIEYLDGSALDSLEVYTVPVDGEGVCRITGGGGAAPAALGTLTVINNCASAAIYRVRYRPTHDAAWGEDRLGAAEVIGQNGGRRSFALAPGTYNVRVEMGDGRSLDCPDVYQITSGQENTCTVFDTAASMGRLTVENGTGQPIYRVRIRAVGGGEWGPDRLGSDTIADGASCTWDVAPGRYHVKIEFADGQVLDSLEEYVVTAGGEPAKCSVWRQR